MLTSSSEENETAKANVTPHRRPGEPNEPRNHDEKLRAEAGETKRLESRQRKPETNPWGKTQKKRNGVRQQHTATSEAHI